MTIYRFQTSAGHGAYRNNTSHTGYFDCKGYYDERQPSPHCDNKLEIPWRERSDHEWKFGFKNIKQANRWFTKKDQKKMTHFGINMYKIEIKSKYVLIGNTQTAYRTDKILSCQLINLQ